MRALRQIGLILGLLSGVLAAGTVGYRWVEGWSWFDCFYMALTTLTTVGYEEIHPLSHDGRIFNSFLILSGVVVVFVSIGVLGEFIVSLELGAYFGGRRRQRMVEKLSKHYIVCGAGRVGRAVVGELLRSGSKLVIIDNSPSRAQWSIDQGLPTLIADATRDETLHLARVEAARGLVAAIGSDAENVYVILSARVLNPKLLIAARASTEQAEEKLRRAGASTVFTPYAFIGHRLAQSILRPHVLSFLDVASAFRGSDLDLEIEQVRVAPSSVVASSTLEKSKIRQTHGVIVLAIMKPGGKMAFNPSGDTHIEAGDVLIAMGERTKLKRLEGEVEG